MEVDRVSEKIEEIEKYLYELSQALPSGFEEYERDFKIKAICERYLEKIVEAAVDLAYLFIKEQGWKLPETEKELFDILTKQGIISKHLAQRLKDAKGMRNILAHEYGEINNELVFIAVTEELEKDIREMITALHKK